MVNTESILSDMLCYAGPKNHSSGSASKERPFMQGALVHLGVWCFGPLVIGAWTVQLTPVAICTWWGQKYIARLGLCEEHNIFLS
jgi:hypothetical protein